MKLMTSHSYDARGTAAGGDRLLLAASAHPSCSRALPQPRLPRPPSGSGASSPSSSSRAGNGPDRVPLQVTVSIGVATLESTQRDLDELIAAADVALYRAKAAGRNCIRVMPSGSA
jgi:GGDEF domain-containing protein